MHISEKQIEAVLSPETRLLPLPDGRQRAYTDTVHFWSAYDYVIAWGYSAERLVELTLREMEETKRSFELSFSTVVCYINNAYVRAFGTASPNPL